MNVCYILLFNFFAGIFCLCIVLIPFVKHSSNLFQVCFQRKVEKCLLVVSSAEKCQLYS